jgi:hypothetical protein
LTWQDRQKNRGVPAKRQNLRESALSDITTTMFTILCGTTMIFFGVLSVQAPS